METKKYKILSERYYHIFKYAAAIVLPALAKLISQLGTTWDWTLAPQISETVAYIGIFMGAIIVLDEVTAEKGGDSDDVH